MPANALYEGGASLRFLHNIHSHGAAKAARRTFRHIQTHINRVWSWVEDLTETGIPA